MLNIGVQTKGLLPEMEIQQAFQFISDVGFDCVDINIDAFLRNTDLYAGNINKFFDASIEDLMIYFFEYRKAMQKYGIRASQMHTPYPVRVQGRGAQNDYMQTNVIPKSIIIAETLGVPWIVVHPFKMQYIYSKKEEKEVNIAYFKMLIPMLKQCGVKICFENLYEGIGSRLVEGVCANPQDAVWYVDTLNDLADEELFGFCLDTGHLQLVKRNAYEFIKILGHRIKLLHLHENDGVGDLHQMPFTFGSKSTDGQDWDNILRGLKEVGFNGTLSFETYPCMNSFPKTMRHTVLKTIYEIGVYMAEKFEEI